MMSRWNFCSLSLSLSTRCWSGIHSWIVVQSITNNWTSLIHVLKSRILLVAHNREVSSKFGGFSKITQQVSDLDWVNHNLGNSTILLENKLPTVGVSQNPSHPATNPRAAGSLCTIFVLAWSRSRRAMPRRPLRARRRRAPPSPPTAPSSPSSRPPHDSSASAARGSDSSSH